MERIRLRRGSAKILSTTGLPAVAVVVIERASVLPEHDLQTTWKTVKIGNQ
jgi:hypothetical protein